ncbi:MAG TPA: non-homologous end-joining DNA ligase [Solirubrobacterales bacterium]|nr:non-homologous end-joining DNA ligase [Solirubrobacterales bacterium]
MSRRARASALEVLSDEERRELRGSSQPRRIEPMKAVLHDRAFSDPDWIYERKLDGVRCLVFRTPRGVRLLSRTDHSLDNSYPELVEALESEPCQDFIVDGEIVAFSGHITSFSRLQRRMQISDPKRARRTGVAVYLYLFDILHLEGHDTRRLPQRTRKKLLRRALDFHGPIRFLSHRNRDGEKLFVDACRRGLEGLIAKRAESRYSSTRSTDWLKLKCSHEQELVIGGFTAPQGRRTDFGALLVGYNEDGELRYAGKVGTGFDQRTLSDLGERMRKLERPDPPFVDVHPVPKGTRWIEPELVGQFAFSEWTRDGRLRHPRYLGLRNDKPPEDVVRERPRRAVAGKGRGR